MSTKTVKVTKSNGVETTFDTEKIARSIMHANMDVAPECQMTDGRIRLIATEAFERCFKKGEATTADIRTIVETEIIKIGSAELARAYIIRGAVRSAMLRESKAA